MSFILLVSTLFFTSSSAQNAYIQFTAEKIANEKLPFSQILMNIKYESNTLSVDLEIQRSPESQDVTNVYQLTHDRHFYSSKTLGVEAKQRFLDAERLFDPETWDSATLDDVNSVYLKKCIDLNQNPEWFENAPIVGPTPLQDTLFRDDQNRVVIQFLNRKYVLGAFENGVPTKLFISGNTEGTFKRADVTFFEWSTSTPFTTQWSTPLPSTETCLNLTSNKTIIHRHDVIIGNDGELVPQTPTLARRLGAEDTRTGPCRDSECCPTGLESICTSHKQLFMTHDAYRTASCPLTYAGNQCTQHTYNADTAIICQDSANIFQYTGENRCYVSFSGSNDIEDWVSNINFLSASWEGYTTHAGFRDEFNGIGMFIYNNLGACLTYNKIEIMGHSLGGAMAMMLGVYIAKYNSAIQVEVVTVGGPSVFKNTQPSFGTRYHQTSYISEYLDWDNYLVWYYWDPVPYLPPGSFVDPFNTQYVWLCYKKDEVCSCYWDWGIVCNCVTYHHYYSQGHLCDGSLGLPSIDQHRRSAYYNSMENMNYGQCGQD